MSIITRERSERLVGAAMVAMADGKHVLFAMPSMYMARYFFDVIEITDSIVGSATHLDMDGLAVLYPGNGSLTIGTKTTKGVFDLVVDSEGNQQN